MMCFSEHWLFVWTSRRKGAAWNDLMTPSHFRKDGPCTRWEIFLKNVKERSVPAQLLMPEDALTISVANVKDVPSCTGVREYVGIWCLPSCWELYNQHCESDFWITRELFGRTEGRKTNVSFPFSSMTGLQLSPVVRTAGCHIWRGVEVDRWWWMCSSRLLLISLLWSDGSHWWCTIVWALSWQLTYVPVGVSWDLILSHYPILCCYKKARKSILIAIIPLTREFRLER